MNKRARKNAKPDKTPASNLKEALTLGGALFEREVHVELCGNREAMIDGCQGIVEYNEEAIRLHHQRPAEDLGPWAADCLPCRGGHDCPRVHHGTGILQLRG